MHYTHEISDEAYMYEFRTNFCKKKRCRSKSKCFDAHSKNMKRRVPKLNADGLFNYIPEDCPQWKNSKKEKQCSWGDKCLRSHGFLEKIFHPLLYKTKICKSSHKNGICTEFGDYCAFARSTSEIRDLVEIYGEDWKQHYDVSDREKKDCFKEQYIQTDKTNNVANHSTLTIQSEKQVKNKWTDSEAVSGHPDSPTVTFSSPSLLGSCGNFCDLLANFSIDGVTSYIQLYSDDTFDTGCNKTFCSMNSACHLPTLPLKELTSISNFMRPIKEDSKLSYTHERDCFLESKLSDLDIQISNVESQVSDADTEKQKDGDQAIKAHSLFAHFNFGYE